MNWMNGRNNCHAQAEENSDKRKGRRVYSRLTVSGRRSVSSRACLCLRVCERACERVCMHACMRAYNFVREVRGSFAGSGSQGDRWDGIEGHGE
jgi:hypothetical protein